MSVPETCAYQLNFTNYIIFVPMFSADLKGKKTNHGARRTMIQHLRKENVAPDRIMKLTGQKNLKSIMSYDSPDEDEQAELSGIVSKLHGCRSTYTAPVISGNSTFSTVDTQGLGLQSVPTPANKPMSTVLGLQSATTATNALPPVVQATTNAQSFAAASGDGSPCVAAFEDAMELDLVGDEILANMPMPVEQSLAPSMFGGFGGAIFNGPVTINFNIKQ